MSRKKFRKFLKKHEHEVRNAIYDGVINVLCDDETTNSPSGDIEIPIEDADDVVEQAAGKAFSELIATHYKEEDK